MKVTRIIVHHSLTKDSGTVSWGAIRKYHTDPNGEYKMDDIGYHAGVELVTNQDVSYYEILLGRMWDRVGAHTKGYNEDSLGICFVGNFDEGDVPEQQMITGAKLIAYWCRLFGLTIHNIFPHWAFADKSCPGKYFSMAGLRHLVENLG